MNEPIAIVVAALIALVGSIAGGWWASTRLFYRQRWWERKAAAYSELVSELSSTHYYIGILNRHYRSEALSNDETLAEYETKIHAHSERAFHAGNMSGFLISREAGDSVVTLRKQLIDGPYESDMVKRLERDRLAVETCVSSVIRFARIDLKIKD
jgi:hypothetical protein